MFLPVMGLEAVGIAAGKKGWDCIAHQLTAEASHSAAW